jgi:hypothetical protein
MRKLGHPEKQFLPMISTLDGIQIDDKEEQALKALFSRLLSFEPVSNVTSRKLLHGGTSSLNKGHPEKQHSPMISTLDGIQIDDKK